MQPKGLLTVVGSLNISQFWPATKGTNSSDGDTVHLKVDPNTSFVFSTSPGAKPKTTTKFVGAYVNDHGKKKNVLEQVETGGKVRATPIAANGALFVLTENRSRLLAIGKK